MAEGKLHINLHLYDTDLAVNVPREDEIFYRNASTMITDVVNTYAKLFRGRKSDKEVLYMSMLDIALRFEKEKDRNDIEPFRDILGKLTSEIEDALK